MRAGSFPMQRRTKRSRSLMPRLIRSD